MLLNIVSQGCEKAISELNDGKCIAVPTETVYGLAADATNGEAVARIFEMKGRPRFNPLIAHVANLEMAKKHGQFNDLAEKLADTFWPGPLTLVVPLLESSEIHPLVTADLGSVGLRCPKGVAREIIETFGRPLAAPSANRSGRISSTTAAHVIEEFEDTGLLITEGTKCEVGIESTILKVDGDNLILLRPGSITENMITKATGIRPSYPGNHKILAPGMMKSHYAPNARLLLNQTNIPAGANILAFGNNEKLYKPRRLFNLSSGGSLREAASNLYKGMKFLDAMGVDVIHVSPIPYDGLGAAINDRLKRAAAPKDEDQQND